MFLFLLRKEGSVFCFFFSSMVSSKFKFPWLRFWSWVSSVWIVLAPMASRLFLKTSSFYLTQRHELFNLYWNMCQNPKRHWGKLVRICIQCAELFVFVWLHELVLPIDFTDSLQRWCPDSSGRRSDIYKEVEERCSHILYHEAKIRCVHTHTRTHTTITA